jgi:Xaa-Pro aminopeptidase
MNPVLKQLSASFSSAKVDACLVFDPTNIRYLTGRPARDSWLLVTRTKAFYITDFRYTGELSRRFKNIQIEEHHGQPLKLAMQLARRSGARTVGFDTRHVSVEEYRILKRSCPKKVKLKTCNGLVEELRVIKRPAELRAIRRALECHQEALKYVKRIICPGVTEREILSKLENYVKKRGRAFSFDPIIASGPNSSYPHASVTGRKIKNNDVVLVDFGIDFEGYKSDLTRMFYLGKISKLVADVSSYVAAAQQRAIAAMGPGVAVKTVDQAARQFLKERKLDRYFGHSLGHGVGLKIHEAPRLSGRSPEILRPGMIVTVEPGVYLTGRFGVRLEEMVYITKTGCEVISDRRN